MAEAVDGQAGAPSGDSQSEIYASQTSSEKRMFPGDSQPISYLSSQETNNGTTPLTPNNQMVPSQPSPHNDGHGFSGWIKLWGGHTLDQGMASYEQGVTQAETWAETSVSRNARGAWVVAQGIINWAGSVTSGAATLMHQAVVLSLTAEAISHLFDSVTPGQETSSGMPTYFDAHKRASAHIQKRMGLYNMSNADSSQSRQREYARNALWITSIILLDDSKETALCLVPDLSDLSQVRLAFAPRSKKQSTPMDGCMSIDRKSLSSTVFVPFLQAIEDTDDQGLTSCIPASWEKYKGDYMTRVVLGLSSEHTQRSKGSGQSTQSLDTVLRCLDAREFLQACSDKDSAETLLMAFSDLMQTSQVNFTPNSNSNTARVMRSQVSCESALTLPPLPPLAFTPK